MGQKEQERNRKIVEQLISTIFSAENIRSVGNWVVGIFKSFGKKFSSRIEK